MLKELRVRYGELIVSEDSEVGDESVLIRRAGFGVEEEVRLLTKGARYGRQREKYERVGWI